MLARMAAKEGLGDKPTPIHASSAYPTSLDLAERRSLTALGRSVRFPVGAVIFREGEVSGRVILLVRGHVKVICTTRDGREVVLAIRGSGDLLGEISAVDGGPHSATCLAMEPVDAMVMGSQEFVRFLEEAPSVAMRLLQTIMARLRDADRKRVEFGGQDTLGRVAARLVELVENYGRHEGGRVTIDLAFSQHDLAAWVGASRESVVKALSTMRSNGWIETGRRRLSVLDLTALRKRGS